MRTYTPKPADIKRKWYLIDAENQILGRLATKVANLLRGKGKPIFTTHIDTGDFVIVVNAEKVKLTGKKTQDKACGYSIIIIYKKVCHCDKTEFRC